ncbi:MAG: hypothetical protein K0R24_1834 [Gammaproteobacteria bacterium]|jgi:hypothetical protein|nr:hypothetical protein [Gammaproteobacteria bacterium]
MTQTDLSDICEALAEKTYTFLKKEIEEFSASHSIPKEEVLKLGLGTTAFLSAVMIDIMDQRNGGLYREDHFYQDVSIILNKVLRETKEQKNGTPRKSKSINAARV